jgi:hypothetical protein
MATAGHIDGPCYQLLSGRASSKPRNERHGEILFACWNLTARRRSAIQSIVLSLQQHLAAGKKTEVFADWAIEAAVNRRAAQVVGANGRFNCENQRNGYDLTVRQGFPKLPRTKLAKVTSGRGQRSAILRVVLPSKQQKRQLVRRRRQVAKAADCKSATVSSTLTGASRLNPAPICDCCNRRLVLGFSFVQRVAKAVLQIRSLVAMLPRFGQANDAKKRRRPP